MLQLLGGFQVSQALFAAAKLDLATLMEAAPRSVEDLASASGAQTEPLRRLLRSLASLGVFTTVEPDSFALTPLGSTLASGTPRSMRDVALMYMEMHYGPFGNLLDTLTTGKPAAETYFGTRGFEWFDDHPEEQAHFTGAMRNLTEGLTIGALSAYKLPAATLSRTSAVPTARCCPSSWRAILPAAGFCSIGPRSFPRHRGCWPSAAWRTGSTW